MLNVKTRVNIGSLRTVVETLKTTKGLKVGILDREQANIAKILERGWVQNITPKQAKYFDKVLNTPIAIGATIQLPPRPFLHDSIEYYRDEWRNLLKSLVKDAIGDRKRGYIRDVKAGMELIGEVMVADIQRAIETEGASIGQNYEPRHEFTNVIYENSGTRDPSSPLFGKLAEAIEYEIK